MNTFSLVNNNCKIKSLKDKDCMKKRKISWSCVRHFDFMKTLDKAYPQMRDFT